MKRPYNCILNDPGKIVIVRPSYGIISTLSLPFQLPQGATGEGVSNESAETSSKKKKKKKKKRKREKPDVPAPPVPTNLEAFAKDRKNKKK